LPKVNAGSLNVKAFANRLWGDIYFNPGTRKFTRKPADPEMSRSFVHFVLEPLYKLYSNVLSEDTDTLQVTLESLGIRLKPVMFKMDVRPLLKAIMDQFFGPATGLVDMIVDNIPSPIEGAVSKVSSHIYFSHIQDLYLQKYRDRKYLYRSSNIGLGRFDESL
jgi:U5 small nuclear ribonucleoprotein component